MSLTRDPEEEEIYNFLDSSEADDSHSCNADALDVSDIKSSAFASPAIQGKKHN